MPFRSCLPSFTCWITSASVRLPVAVFSLACCKSMPLPRVWLRSPLSPRKDALHLRSRSGVSSYMSIDTFSIPPVKPCRRRRHFSPQTRMNRFVFLNLPILSLGNHLGVTVSPQSPLPAGYVTLPVDSRSPPLGLMLPHSRKQARQIPPFSMHSKHMPPRFLGARRTIGDIGCPHLIRPIDDHMAQEIREDLVSRRRLCGFGLWSQRRDALLTHQPLHALAIDATPFALSIAIIRREPRNGQAVNSWSIRRISSTSLSLAGRGRRYMLDRATLSSWHCRRIDRPA